MSGRLLRGLDGADPLAFLAACGLLRVVSRVDPQARLGWVQDGPWFASLELTDGLEPVELVMSDVERWRDGHPAMRFAVDAPAKVQDLKHPPAEFRALMRALASDREGAAFVAAYATGVAVDGRGQTKPTAFHFTAGTQRFMNSVLTLLAAVARDDIEEALHGPWKGRKGANSLRWRAASERNRALLAVDPSKDDAPTVVGAEWLAYQALPMFPCVPLGMRVRTTGFTGRGKDERFTWPIWTAPLSLDAVRVLVGMRNLASTDVDWRRARGIGQVFEAAVVRSAQGYGNFAASNPR